MACRGGLPWEIRPKGFDQSGRVFPICSSTLHSRSDGLVDLGWKERGPPTWSTMDGYEPKPWRTNRDETVHETRSEGRNNATHEGGDVHGRKKTSTEDGTRARDTPLRGKDEKESIVDETQSYESTPIPDPYILDRAPSGRPHQVKPNPWQTSNAEK